jgi:hypothetical protein
MKKQIKISIFLIFSTVCYCQSDEQIINILKERFPKSDTIAFESSFYDEANLPKLYKDKILSKCLPNHTFFTFNIQFRGCYGLEPKIGLIIYNKSKNSFVIQQNMLYSTTGIENDFTGIIQSYRTNNQSDFIKYIERVANLLFSTLHVKEINKTVVNGKYLTFFSKNYGQVNFEFEENNLLKIEYSYK